MTTIKTERPNYITKEAPWDYQYKDRGKMVDDITAHEMTRSGRGYAPEDLN